MELSMFKSRCVSCVLHEVTGLEKATSCLINTRKEAFGTVWVTYSNWAGAGWGRGVGGSVEQIAQLSGLRILWGPRPGLLHLVSQAAV